MTDGGIFARPFKKKLHAAIFSADNLRRASRTGTKGEQELNIYAHTQLAHQNFKGYEICLIYNISIFKVCFQLQLRYAHAFPIYHGWCKLGISFGTSSLGRNIGSWQPGAAPQRHADSGCPKPLDRLEMFGTFGFVSSPWNTVDAFFYWVVQRVCKRTIQQQGFAPKCTSSLPALATPRYIVIAVLAVLNVVTGVLPRRKWFDSLPSIHFCGIHFTCWTTLLFAIFLEVLSHSNRECKGR